MADYTTHFSALFDVRTPENVDRALAVHDALAREIEEEDETSLNFVLSPERDEPGSEARTILWIHDGDYGYPGHVVAFVKRCAAAFELDGRWGFVWSHDCSKPRLDAYGGGAAVIDLASGTSETIDVSDWLADRLAGRAASGPPTLLAELLALLKEPAQPMGLSEHDFRRWLPRAVAAIARAEAALGIGAGEASPEPGLRVRGWRLSP